MFVYDMKLIDNTLYIALNTKTIIILDLDGEEKC